MAKDKFVCKEIGEWSIECRTRNNHAGFKVWILHHGREVVSLDERGCRQRDGGRIIVPEDIINIAKQIWSDIDRGAIPASI